VPQRRLRLIFITGGKISLAQILMTGLMTGGSYKTMSDKLTDRIEQYLSQLAPHVEKREAAQLLREALTEIERLQAVVSRLASVEAFEMARAFDKTNPADQELLARMEFAEKALRGSDD
jgi:hypothetical protein